MKKVWFQDYKYRNLESIVIMDVLQYVSVREMKDREKYDTLINLRYIVINSTNK